jgi:hypothetical protein
VDICTVISRSHVAGARVLAKSHAAVHPDATCTVLVVDDDEGLIDPAGEPFEVLRPDDIEIDGFLERAGYYPPLELTCSLKPALLTHVVGHSGIAAYMDADMEIYSSLSELGQRAREAGIVLTPHSTTPLPNDERIANQGSVLNVGAFNAGFVAVSDAEEPRRILGWWDSWLRTECVLDQPRARCYDQTWLDLVPGFASRLHVERDAGFNVAYWNLHERWLARSEDGWTVNGRPLGFFHFSGFNPKRPNRLRDGDDRTGDLGAPLSELLATYAVRLMDNGWAEAQTWSYGLSVLPNGLHLDDSRRRRYRLALERGEIDRPLFSQEGADRFAELLDGDDGAADTGDESRRRQRLRRRAQGVTGRLR